MTAVVQEGVAVAGSGCADLSIIVPTFNERDNVPLLLKKIEAALPGVAWEIVFIDDDSSDGTIEVLRSLSRRDPRVRSLHRIGRRGLSSAVVEGILSTSSPYVAVMDADLQHDERLLGQMLDVLRDDEADIVVGSRYCGEGSVGAWDERRQKISRIATELSRLVVKADLTDPMSGFFMLRRSVFEGAMRHLSIQGYKILLDILASTKSAPRVKELPYVFGLRQHGESKLDALVTLEYLNLLLDKMFGGVVPVRFIMFAAIGGIGVIVHMLVLGGLLKTGIADFLVAQTSATIAAMTFNFFVNNVLTYRDKRLRGFGPVLVGLLSFYAVCAVGAVANVGIANVLFHEHYSWWLAGVAGILVGAVWNYALSSIFTWRSK
jgi:dolichol-phosphate mannosyltransferase